MKSSRNRLLGVAAYVVTAVLVLMTSLSASAQDRVPRFEPAECPFERGAWARDATFECKWLVVPEARANPKSRTIKLAVAILRAREPDGSPPLVMLHGGPGGSGVRSFTRVAVELSLNQSRDVVTYDQRGAGFSEPKLCPEFKDVASDLQKLKTQKEQNKFEEAAIRKCIRCLDARIDRSAYNTIESALDMIDLRHTLGYSSWDIFGDSYGARLAQEEMRRDPKGIRSVVLSKPVTRGPAFQAEVALSNQRAFERVFADCNEQQQCRTAFPTLEKDFYEIYDDLNKTPLSVQLDQKPNDVPVVLDGKRLVDRIRNDVISPGDPKKLGLLPLLLNEFRRGDKMRAARILVGYNPRVTIQGDRVLVNIVNCNDIYGDQLRATRKAINAQVRAPFRRDLMDECKLWQKRSPNPAEWEPVRSDIPALILTGRYDDRVPTEQAKRIALTLTRAYVYEFRSEAHGPQPTAFACHRQIILQFWENQFREPDASCISQLQPINFATTWDKQ
jgi:pimeloyl-ACP methyl ester carboxylesterase